MGMLSVHTSPSLLCLAFDLPTPAGLSHLTASALFLHLSVRAPRFGVGAGGGVCRCGRREEFWFVLCCAVLCQGRRRAFLSLFFLYAQLSRPRLVHCTKHYQYQA